jgi:hypothetical protein
MSYLFDNNDYKCGIIKNMKLNINIINEFKENYVEQEMWNDYYNDLLANNLEKLFVMVLKLNDKNEDKMCHILDEEMFESLKNNGGIIVGFIKIQNSRKYIIKNKNFWYIDLIDTRLSNQHIARIMLYKLKLLKKRDFVPLIIAKKAIKYWRKYFKVEYGLITQEQIMGFIESNNISQHNNWDILFENEVKE